MIPLEQLRRGNWVDSPAGRGQVTVIGDDYARVNGMDDWDHDLQPIPLSPEVLAKCGFETDNITTWHPKMEWIWLAPCGIEGYDAFTHGLSSGPTFQVKYLHQLQNLFFALTGQELSFTP